MQCLADAIPFHTPGLAMNGAAVSGLAGLRAASDVGPQHWAPGTRLLRRTRQDLSATRCRTGCLRTAPLLDRTACARRRPRARVGRRRGRRSRTVTVWVVAMPGILRTSNVACESSGAVWKTAYSSVR